MTLPGGDDREPEPAAPRLVAAVVAAILIAHVVLAWWSRPPGILTGQDDAQYLALAQSLRQGGYYETFRIDNPIHSLYPPGYPLLLAVWGGLFGDRFDTLVASSVLLSAASLLLWFAALRRRFPVAVAGSAQVLLALNPDLIEMASTVRSEIGYLFWTVLAWYLIGADREPAARVAGRARTGWGGAAAIVATMTRIVGVTMLLALIADWLSRRRWRTAAGLALGALVPVGGWLVWTSVAPDQYVGMSYAADLAAGLTDRPWVTPLPGRIPDHLLFYSQTFLRAIGVPNLPGTAVESAAALILLGAALAVGWWALLQTWRALALYLLFSFGLLAVWTFTEHRYFAPLMVVVVPAVLLGVDTIVRRRWPLRASAVTVGVALLLAGGAGWRSLEQAGRYRGCQRGAEPPAGSCLTPDQRAFFEALRWIRDRLPPDAVLLSAKYAALHYYTGRRTTPYRAALARDTSALLPFLAEQKTDWILLTNLLNLEPRRLVPKLEPLCRQLALERHFPPRAYLLRVRQANDTTDWGSGCRAVAAFAENHPSGRREETRRGPDPGPPSRAAVAQPQRP
jgi:hypothetical protein